MKLCVYRTAHHAPGRRKGSPFAGRLVLGTRTRVVEFVDKAHEVVGTTVLGIGESDQSERVQSLRPDTAVGWRVQHARAGAIELIFGLEQVAVAAF